MITDDLCTADGPSDADLKVLERLASRRRAFEAVEPADEDQARLLARVLAILDDMEECLCEEGHRAPALDEGWRVLDDLDDRLSEPQAPPTDEGATSHDGAVVSIHRRHRPVIPPTEGTVRPPEQGETIPPTAASDAKPAASALHSTGIHAGLSAGDPPADCHCPGC